MVNMLSKVYMWDHIVYLSMHFNFLYSSASVACTVEFKSLDIHLISSVLFVQCFNNCYKAAL